VNILDEKMVFLKEELYRWIAENNGKVPCKDDMKVKDGFPSSYEYQKVFGLPKWNDILFELEAKPNNVSWTNEGKQFVIENWGEMSDSELAISLNRTKSSIVFIRQELGLFRQIQKQKWLEWEIEFLKENFNAGGQDYITKVLSPRKWETIRAYATKNLKLKRKHSNYFYQLGDGTRKCKECEEVFFENEENFYSDGTGFRTSCISCYNDEQERIARKGGALTKKLKEEKFVEGLARCSGCKEWQSVHEFRNNHSDLRQLHRYCEEFEKEYLWNYYLEKRYGPNYLEWYPKLKRHLYDERNVKWGSIDEVMITNWLIKNGYDYKKEPKYKDIFTDDESGRLFDWNVNINGEDYLVEYFGLWDYNSSTKYIENYTDNAKKKIEKLYKNRDSYNFIVFFPNELKDLEKVFSGRTF